MKTSACHSFINKTQTESKNTSLLNPLPWTSLKILNKDVLISQNQRKRTVVGKHPMRTSNAACLLPSSQLTEKPWSSASTCFIITTAPLDCSLVKGDVRAKMACRNSSGSLMSCIVVKFFVFFHACLPSPCCVKARLRDMFVYLVHWYY